MRHAAACLALLAVLAAPARAAPAPPCPAFDNGELDVGALPHLDAALKHGGKLGILAIGSAGVRPDAELPFAGSGAPPAAPAPPASPTGFPWQFAHALETAVKGLHVSVTVRGGRLLSAADMEAMIEAELAHGGYRLVLWQTGTVDAVQDLPPGDFYQALSDGAASVAGAGADLILVDPQYSRFLEANANLQPYLSAMQSVGDLPGVMLFDRYALMRDWADAGAIDLEHAAKPDRPAQAARLHACLARALAHMVIPATP